MVLSQYVEEDYAFELLSDGVEGLGYLLKERVTQVDDLVRALHDVARGGSALDPKVVEGLLARKSHRAELGAARDSPSASSRSSRSWPPGAATPPPPRRSS